MGRIGGEARVATQTKSIWIVAISSMAKITDSKRVSANMAVVTLCILAAGLVGLLISVVSRLKYDKAYQVPSI